MRKGAQRHAITRVRRIFSPRPACAEKRSHQSRGVTRSGAREASQLSFHSLRRTATTLLHEAGIPQAVAQALIGHDSAAVHEIYVSVGREALVKRRGIISRRALKRRRPEEKERVTQ
jgi:integrase